MAAYTDLKCIGEVELTEEIDFLDGEFHNVKIEYEEQILKIYLNSQPEPIMSV